MNQRIKELAEQAGLLAKTIGPTVETRHMKKKEQDLEKFAELIVKECIGCCEQAISDPVPKSVDTWLNGGEQCIQEIKQHFGIKE